MTKNNCDNYKYYRWNWNTAKDWQQTERNYLLFVLLHRCDIVLLLKGNNSWMINAITGEQAQDGRKFGQWFNDKFLGSNLKDKISIKYLQQFAESMIFIIIKKDVQPLGKNVQIMDFINQTLGTSLFHGPNPHKK